jgi:polar amino acid transport system substrate-binding protein
MRRQLMLAAFGLFTAFAVQAAPDCGRPLTLALHDHGLLYSSITGEGIDRDMADELTRRSGCRIHVSVMPRARIWQLIESGALDFSLSGITNESRDRFASFAWYFSNKYYLLVREGSRVQKVADFERDESLTLGVIRSFRYSPSANRFVDALQEQQRVSYATQLEPLYEVLLANRIQAMIIEPFDYPTVQGQRLRELTRIVEFDDPAVRHGLIMSRKSLTPAQQREWAALVEAMRADGTVQRIFEKYFPAPLAREMTQF